MATHTLTDAKYQRLVSDVQKMLTEGRAEAERLVKEQALVTYWCIGKRLVDDGLTGSENYGQAILEDLADEVDIDLRTIQRCIAFFKEYKAVPKNRNLTWTHVKFLLSINDPDKRSFYENKVSANEWTVRDLKKAIKAGGYSGKKAKKPRLKRPSGSTYIYPARIERVLDADTAIFLLDVGFEVWKEQRIRFAGLDAAPISESEGKQAYRFVRDRLNRAKTIIVKTNRTDIYGRYIGHVFYSYDNMDKDDVFRKGRYLNDELVRKDLARKD